MINIYRNEAFAFYGAKLKDQVSSVSAENEEGELVVSLWSHRMLPSDGKAIRFADRVSRWPGPGGAEFGERIGRAYETGQVLRLIIARTNDEEAVEAGKDASKLKNTFVVKPQWFGRVTHWDGDNYEVEFVEKKRRERH